MKKKRIRSNTLVSIELQEILIKNRIIPIGATYSEQFSKMLEGRKA